MTPELDKKLCEDFPELYADRHADMRSTAMCWGFSCGDGWEPLIRKLSEQLTFLSKVENAPIRASQVKEKFGTLRFYTTGATDIMYACIRAAEALSGQTCERCGEDGKTRNGGWVSTLCAKHAHESKYAISKWEAERLGLTEYTAETEEE